MTKKPTPKKERIKTTHEELLKSMTPKERKKHNEEYKAFILSEMLLCMIAKEKPESVKKLAKHVGIPEEKITSCFNDQQDYNFHAVFKMLKEIGCSSFILKYRKSEADVPIEFEVNNFSKMKYD